MSRLGDALRQRWRVLVLGGVIVALAVVWAVFPSLLGGTPDAIGSEEVGIADIACGSCGFFLLESVDVAAEGGRYPLDRFEGAVQSDADPTWAILGARPTTLAFTVGNTTEDSRMLLTGVEIELRDHRELPEEAVLGCRVPEDDGVSVSGTSAEAMPFTAAIGPELVGSARAIPVSGGADGAMELQPSGLQQYRGELALSEPGIYTLGVRVSYDTSQGASGTVESGPISVMRVRDGDGVTMVPSDTRPVCRSAGFPGSGRPHLLTDVRVEPEGNDTRIVFEFTDQAPAVSVEVIEPPIMQQPSGRELEVAGESFLAVTMMPAARVDLSGEEPEETYAGPVELTPEAGAVAEMELTEASGGVMTWAVGLDGDRPFSFDRGTRSLEILVGPPD